NKMKLNNETSSQQQLLIAQRAWLKFRDAECKIYEKMYEGGTIQGLAVLSCLEGLTKERRLRLNGLFDEINR
ncbi:MAG: lysozyme inhibitor LprI family protein, partial [Neisseriaceae bacterium]|nr:lysozyme inhibitor LprI family protein [Neisseriaceae bacterium]